MRKRASRGGAAVVATVGAPLVAAVAVGYVASEVFDSVCDLVSDWF